MKIHFKSKGFEAFRRQLALYGFKREKNTNKQPIFQHPFLIRDREDLIHKIERSKQIIIKTAVSINRILIDSCRLKISKNKDDSKERNLSKLRLMFLDSLEHTNKYFGKGIANFLDRIILMLNNTFPRIRNRLSFDIQNAKQTIHRTRLYKQTPNLSTRELLIKLINSFLSEIDKELTEASINQRVTEFDKSLMKLDEIPLSFCRTISERKNKNSETLFDRETSSLLLSPIHQCESKSVGQNHIDNSLESFWQEESIIMSD